MRNTNFKSIAEIIKADYFPWRSIEETNTCNRLAHRLADYFEKINPQFNHGEFLTECGIFKEYVGRVKK